MPRELLTYLSWRSALLVLAVFGFAPGAVLRIVVLAFHRDDPRRAEMLGELRAVPFLERPLWVAQQLEVAVFEGLGERIRWAATGRIIDRWHLVDGEAMHRDHPETFDVPDEEDKEAIETGDRVKAGFAMKEWGERMWLIVVDADPRHLICRLDSHPLAIPKLSCGDTIRIRRKHVIDVRWHDVDYTELNRAELESSAASGSPWDGLERCCGCDACVSRQQRDG